MMQKPYNGDLYIDTADIDAGIYVVNELREIFIMIKGLLNNLKKKIRQFPVYSIVGLSTRNFTLKFVNAWHDPLERTLRTLETSDYKKIIFQSNSSNCAMSRSGQKEKGFCIEEKISLVTILLNRLCEVIEFISSTLTDSGDPDARNELGLFGIWLCIQMRPFPKIVYPRILEEFPESLRGLNDLRPKGC